MPNKLNFFYLNFSFLASLLQEKIPHSINHVYLEKLHFSFFVKNSNQNRLLFLLKIMLLEKLTTNKLRFIVNMRLLRKKTLKVGGSIIVAKQKIHNLLLSLFYNSLVKLIYSVDSKLNNYYIFYDKKWHVYKILFFVLTKFLFFNYFSYHFDYYNYYSFFENVIYQLKIKVCTCFKYYLMNRDLMRLIGLNII
jgi:hypothetical protein